jgi:hypothetical protein
MSQITAAGSDLMQQDTRLVWFDVISFTKKQMEIAENGDHLCTTGPN